MSDQAVIWSKWFTYYEIILAKGQLDHCHLITFKLCLLWYFAQSQILGIALYLIWETSRNKLQNHSVSKIVLVTSEIFLKFYSITRTFFSHRKSEQFRKQNTKNAKGKLFRNLEFLNNLRSKDVKCFQNTLKKKHL